MNEENPYEKKPWLRFYDEHVPEHLEYPDTPFVQLFREAVEPCGDRVALHYMGRAIRFREIDLLSNKFARFLQESGLEPGDVVGVNLPNIPAFYIAIIGIQKAGCVLSGVSPLLTPEELEYQLNDSGARALVTLDALFANVEEVAQRTGLRAVVVAETADFLPVGEKAPDIQVTGAARHGVLADPVKLSDLRGETVVLAFFFKARTGG